MSVTLREGPEAHRQPARSGEAPPMQRDFSRWIEATRDASELSLGLPGFSYEDLHRPERLEDLSALFESGLDGEAARALASLRSGEAEAAGPEAVSTALLQVAPHVSAFVAKLFRVEAEVLALREQVAGRRPLWDFKRDFVKKRVLKPVCWQGLRRAARRWRRRRRPGDDRGDPRARVDGRTGQPARLGLGRGGGGGRRGDAAAGRGRRDRPQGREGGRGPVDRRAARAQRPRAQRSPEPRSAPSTRAERRGRREPRRPTRRTSPSRASRSTRSRLGSPRGTRRTPTRPTSGRR